MNKEEIDDYGLSCNYFDSFVKSAINELRKEGYCYIYNEAQLNKILDIFPTAKIEKNECGYTLKATWCKEKSKYE